MRGKTSLVILGLCFLLIFLCGCETIKGATKCGANGFSQDMQNTKKHITNAAKNTAAAVAIACKKTGETVTNTVKNTVEGVIKADGWMRENLW